MCVAVCSHECSHTGWGMSDWVRLSGTHVCVAVLAGECEPIWTACLVPRLRYVMLTVTVLWAMENWARERG